MEAIKATIGEKYLFTKGTPVVVLAHRGDKVILKVSGSDNEVSVANDYELHPYNRAQVSKAALPLEQAYGSKAGRKPRGKSVAAMIDPYLFEGGKTVKEIADLVTEKAGALAKNRNMEANVRARMVTYSRKGWRVEKNDRKHVTVVKSQS